MKSIETPSRLNLHGQWVVTETDELARRIEEEYRQKDKLKINLKKLERKNILILSHKKVTKIRKI